MTDEELKQLIESNARAIQAMIEQRVTDRLNLEEKLRIHEQRLEFLAENQRQIVQTQQGIANLISSLDEDRPTVLRKLNTIENKIDQILENQ
ncbi:MAG: hypothetical protein ACRC2S_10810 [Waterburya sp.]